MCKGVRLTLPPIICRPGDDSYSGPGFKHCQFPILFYFAVTKNRIQEQSFSETLEINQCKDFISHAQVYIALSRPPYPSNIVGLNKMADRKMKNIGYPEVRSNNELAREGILPLHVTILHRKHIGRLPSRQNMMGKWNNLI